MWHPRWLSGMRRTDDGCVRRGVPALEPGRDRLAWLLFGMCHTGWLSGMRRTDGGCVRRGWPALDPGRDRLAWLLFGQRSLRVHTRRGPVRGSPRRHARAVRTVAKPEALALVVAGGCR